ncbi:prepilin peptidase-dependent protein [Ewingella sp. S1.OA.A_B6]
MPLNQVRSQGFTLPEVLMAISIGSMLMLSAAQLYPMFRHRSQSLGRHFQLDQLLRGTAFNIEKDLRRAGFCNGECKGKAVMIGNSDGEAANSCVIIIYDLNRNGRWDPPGSIEPDYFGYRLRDRGIETQRGTDNCSEGGWEKLLDPSEVQVTGFKITDTVSPKNGHLYSISLSARWRDALTIHRHIEKRVAGYQQ